VCPLLPPMASDRTGGARRLIDDVDDDPVDMSDAGTCSSAGGVTGTTAEDLVAVEIRRRREAAGLSQRALAKRAGFSRQYVSRAENPTQGLPSENLVAVLDTALDADGELLGLWRRAVGERCHRRHELSLSARTTAFTDHVAGGTDLPASTGITAIPAAARPTGTPPPGQRRGVIGPPPPEPDVLSLRAASMSVALLADLAPAEIDPLTVDDIEERVDALANGYFRASPAAFRIAVVQLRERVAGLVAIRSRPTQRRRLYVALAALTGMLAESSFAIGDQADVHCATAIALATEARHPDLVAWVRGTQAQIALHTGNPLGAVRYARAGEAAAPSGSTAAVRSAAYLARASARLGDRATASEACRSARAAWERLDGSLSESVFSLNADYLSYCELTTSVWLRDLRLAQRPGRSCRSGRQHPHRGACHHSDRHRTRASPQRRDRRSSLRGPARVGDRKLPPDTSAARSPHRSDRVARAVRRAGRS
jgi:transcriptional regulator with XRE-family HTH domain